jgi:hypothetical protein
MSNPFLNAAYVRSVLTRKIGALEASTQRKPSQSQVKQLNRLTQTYHGILATPSMQPETALEVLTDVSAGNTVPSQADQQAQQKLMETLSNMMKKQHETAKGIIQNLRA